MIVKLLGTCRAKKNEPSSAHEGYNLSKANVAQTYEVTYGEK